MVSTCRLAPRRTPRARSIVVALVGAAVVSLSGPPARAYDRQAGIFLDAGYAGIAGDTPYPPHAIAAGLGFGLGLGDTWELRLRADYAAHFSALHRLTGSVDVVYVVDVLSAVPYLGLSAGGALSFLDPSLSLGDLRGDLALGALVGLDVVLGRSWTVGGEARFAWLVTDLARQPLQFTVVVRAQYLFEI
ncbi:MAG: hypothetical protein ACK6CU_21375 [Deltaproteobacteria bacterium]